MAAIMSKYRRPHRPARRSTLRRATRSAIRVRWRAPDDLGTALACYRRAIAAHRRLARLAPRFFDSAVVDRQRREHEAQRQWMDSWRPAFLKVYGAEPEPLPPAPELPPLPPPRIQAAVERELAAWNFHLPAGSQALRRFELRHPHAPVSLSRLARLMQMASDFGRLATGLESVEPPTEPANHDHALADLERIYGDRHDSPPPAPGSLPAPAPAAQASELVPNPSPAQSAPASRNDAPGQTTGPPASQSAVHEAPTPSQAAPGPLTYPRRDAWSSWARHQRRRLA